MFRLFIYVLIGWLFLSELSRACSCICKYDHTVSDYLEDKKVIWGVPIKSIWQRGEGRNLRQKRIGIVSTQVEVIEGYGQLAKRTKLTTTSSPEDGGNCGLQPHIGVPQMIIATGDENRIGDCSCEPPISTLLDYLKEGKDTFIPHPKYCEKPNKSSYMKEKCKVWDSSDWQSERDERMRIYKIFRNHIAE